MSVKLKAELKLWFIRPNQRQRLLCIAHSLSQIHFKTSTAVEISATNGSVDQRVKECEKQVYQPSNPADEIG
ncbi:Haptoglobin [Trichinella spiralis]|uniref:Haptoglobin n=1 Tax=Trichinella spiralis TaxID=6334 RepID=A0ABR3KXC8_TRISP